MLRLAGGDWNAIVGIAGLVAGIAVGVGFLRLGFNLGRSYPARTLAGLVMPFIMVVLLLLAIFYPHFGDNAALFRTVAPAPPAPKPPGAAAAPVVASILIGLLIGFLAQRTRFCTVGGIRDAILMRDFHLLSGVIAFVATAFVLNLVYKQFHPGFTLGTGADGKAIMQPAAHTVAWLNFAGMALAGLSFTLAGGCPGRQVFLSGEGDGDAAVFVVGMFTGAAVSHNFLMVGGSGPLAVLAPHIVVIGLIVVCLIGILGREKLAVAR
jgi:YedE family putative selenium metabolism protein